MIIIIIMNFLFAITTTVGMTIIPLLVTENLGLSFFILGLIEGGGELISNILRITSGTLFDRMQNRRLLFVTPSALAFVSKVLLLVPNTFAILASKISERISNGTFAVPRDAYIGEYAHNKGVALGALSASKSVGCIIGPLLVSGSVLLIGPLQEGNMKFIVFFACCINLAALYLSFLVCTKKVDINRNQKQFKFTELKHIFKYLQSLFIVSALFFLGRFNDGVMILYLKHQDLPEWFYTTTLATFNFVMFIVSPVMGMLIDMGKGNFVLLLTVISLVLFNILFYHLPLMPWVFAFLGLTCWGIQRAGAQIAFAAIIFKKTPVQYYGTTIGVYSLLSGIGVFTASAISGYLAQTSFSYVFILSGSFALSALLLLFYYNNKQDKNGILS